MAALWASRHRPDPRQFHLREQHGAIRRAADQDHAHEQLRVEPEPDLLAHLGDPVGGEPALPIGLVGQVRHREPLPRALGVAALLEGVAPPAERGERHDARVEPAVADLGDALGDLAGVGADADPVDPRAVQLLEVVARHPRGVVAGVPDQLLHLREIGLVEGPDLAEDLGDDVPILLLAQSAYAERRSARLRLARTARDERQRSRDNQHGCSCCSQQRWKLNKSAFS